MNLGLGGQAAIVTGGSSGIGRAITLGLAREGVDVAVVHLDPEETAAATVAAVAGLGRRAVAVRSDVASFSEAERVVAEVVARWGRLDLLVCSAGITADSVVWKMSERQFDRVLAVNLKGCFNYNRAAASVFKDAKHGKIVNIASINGLRGKLGQANYAASKGGMIALSKTLAKELGKFNVNVNVVAPGMVLTEMMAAVPPELQAAALAETVLGRFATPEDVAHLVCFLCSDLARHITGEVVKLDGGQYI